MEAAKPVRLSREELYGQVWATPMTRLAKGFGVSNTDLAKICRDHDIPTPSSGYWVQRAHGKGPPPPPLPAQADPARQAIAIGAVASRPAKAGVSPPLYGEDLLAVLARAEALP